jgi:hypothetical protein
LFGPLLLGFGVVSSAALVGFGLWQAVRGRYADRFGVVREGKGAIRAGLLVALIGLGELAVTLFLWAAWKG